MAIFLCSKTTKARIYNIITSISIIKRYSIDLQKKLHVKKKVHEFQNYLLCVALYRDPKTNFKVPK